MNKYRCKIAYQENESIKREIEIDALSLRYARIKVDTHYPEFKIISISPVPKVNSEISQI